MNLLKSPLSYLCLVIEQVINNGGVKQLVRIKLKNFVGFFGCFEA